MRLRPLQPFPQWDRHHNEFRDSSQIICCVRLFNHSCQFMKENKFYGEVSSPNNWQNRFIGMEEAVSCFFYVCLHWQILQMFSLSYVMPDCGSYSYLLSYLIAMNFFISSSAFCRHFSIWKRLNLFDWTLKWQMPGALKPVCLTLEWG